MNYKKMSVCLAALSIIACDGGNQRTIEDFHERVSADIDEKLIDCGYIPNEENYPDVIECISQAFSNKTPFFGTFESEVEGGYIGFSGDLFGNILIWKDDFLANDHAFVYSETCTNPVLSNDIISDPHELFHCNES